MELVRRSVMLSKVQADFLTGLHAKGVSGSAVVRIALDQVMGQSHIVVPQNNTKSAKVVTIGVQELAS